MQYDHLYFHVGLHKTASTYLQNVAIPRWPHITYQRYRNIEYFLRLRKEATYMFSGAGLSDAIFATTGPM